MSQTGIGVRNLTLKRHCESLGLDLLGITQIAGASVNSLGSVLGLLGVKRCAHSTHPCDASILPILQSWSLGACVLGAGLLPAELLRFACVLLLGFPFVCCLVWDAQSVVRLPVSTRVGGRWGGEPVHNWVVHRVQFPGWLLSVFSLFN